jgi:hypothetical protein
LRRALSDPGETDLAKPAVSTGHILQLTVMAARHQLYRRVCGGAIVLALASLAIAPCRGACCGGPSTLFNWSNDKSLADDSGGDDSPFSHPIQADRPGFGDSPTTVGCNVYQLELGYQYTYDSDATSSHINYSYPQSLLRVGTLANWFEVRLAWSMEQESDRVFGVSSQTAVGSDDLNVGFKIALTDQAEWLPQMGIVADMYVPTGSSAFTAGEVLPEIEWIYCWSLTKKLSVTGVTFLTDATDGGTGNTYLEVSQGVETDLSLTDAIGSYIDWHNSTPDGADTDRTQQVFEGGFTLLVNNNLVLDAEAGVGLNDATPDYFVGTGLAVRR